MDIQDLDADFLAFSAHKMLGPTGVGILYGKKELLEMMDPFLGGGDMIKKVWKDHAIWADIPFKFEGGTPNIAGVIGFGKAIEYLEEVGIEEIFNHEKSLVSYAIKRLLELDGIRIYGPIDDKLRLNIISFNYREIHPHDVATILDREGIAIRAGHHCAQPLMDYLGVSATCRVSVYLYNTKEEIDILIEGLRKVDKVFKNGTGRTL
jgi:cysteine desulfurase/selenocysteine lyase